MSESDRVQAMRTEWRLCSDGFSSPPSQVVSKAEAHRIMREGIAYGHMNGLWLERRQVSEWSRVPASDTPTPTPTQPPPMI